MNRRSFNFLALFSAFTPNLSGCQSTPRNFWGASRQQIMEAEKELVNLERACRGRLGVHVIDTSTGQRFGHRSDERFLMLSSFKLLAAGFVLDRHDRGEDSLDRRIRYTRADLVEWSPVTEKHVGGDGLTLAELCHATITTSDNTAANLMHQSYGGPAALTRFVRRLGDLTTRHDRYEPDLNTSDPNQPSDTTTPRAIAETTGKLVVGDVLSSSSRRLLQDWLLANTTGGKRLRAGFPLGWRIGEKTGTDPSVGANDVGVAWPPDGAPLLVSAYVETTSVSQETRDATIATVAKLAASLMESTTQARS